MKMFKRSQKYRYGGGYSSDSAENYECGYAQALMDAFLIVWEFIPSKGWISERDLIEAYLDFLSKSEESRKYWPETASYVKLAIIQFDINELIECKNCTE